MKGFTKLALVSAIAALPMTGFAMEALDDAAMSGVTGQDGITLGLSLNASLNVGIEDTDGLGAASSAPNPGMILLVNNSLTGTVNVVIDSGENATGPVLRVGVNVPTLTVQTGDVHVVAGTNGSDVAAGFTNLDTQVAAVAAATPLLENVSITLNDLDLGIELGAGAANFLAIATTSVLAIDIGALGDAADSFVLNDLGASGGGSVFMDQVSIRNVDLNGITANITNAGLVVSTNAALADMDIALMGVRLGDNSNPLALAPSVGNVYISGLNMSGQTITISGH